jgi:hypothetical protein
MRLLTRILFATVAACWCSIAFAAGPAREMHGMSDAFAAPGVALAWGVLRGAGDSQAVVDVRFAVDPMTYPRVVVVGRDPFSSAERVLAASPTPGLTDLRVPRSNFARYPRTEFRFYGTAAREPAETPKLVVYFVGVPDTTPEFANEARLDASLTERIVRARGAAGAKSP